MKVILSHRKSADERDPTEPSVSKKIIKRHASGDVFTCHPDTFLNKLPIYLPMLYTKFK